MELKSFVLMITIKKLASEKKSHSVEAKFVPSCLF